jgi:hypothetical protein
MCKISEVKEKFKKVKEKVEADLSNGKHHQKKIKAKIKEAGYTQQEFTQEISKIVKG